jgi:hypothetical protein
MYAKDGIMRNKDCIMANTKQSMGSMPDKTVADVGLQNCAQIASTTLNHDLAGR